MNATVQGLESANARLSAELEVVNADLESLCYSVSHDLRAPVRAVMGYARAVVDDYGSALDEEGRRLLSVVQSESVRMVDMIDALLALSRLGRHAMESVTVDMMGLVQGVVAEQLQLAGRPQPMVEVADLQAVRGDRALLRQVWTTLISNAVKYSSKQSAPQLQVWAALDAARVVYHVRDNGVGFDMQQAGKLFGVFQTLHRRPEFPGTGVGLAMAKRIVQRHGGTIWADARLGDGATFSFGLPKESVI
ncbi:MAG TPA: ATP-binding protein [Candidatus Tumulicola sp.]|nr:ATP-binding protein [Candidatus Tumulicola sp.]